MKINLIANGYNKLEEVFKRQLENRISASYSSDGLLVELAVDEALGKKDSYEIRENQGKWDKMKNNMGILLKNILPPIFKVKKYGEMVK